MNIMTSTPIALLSALFIASLLALASCGSDAGPDRSSSQSGEKLTNSSSSTSGTEAEKEQDMNEKSLETATLGAGCYWCVEAVLQQVKGVKTLESGFMGGAVENPSYEAVCSGQTGHAEVVQLTFDPSVVSFAEILDWFWKLHDPTTLNRQGADVGTQYRSAIFFHSESQRETAEKSKAAAGAGLDRPIVTEITEASTFYKAKAEHQDFYRRNKRQGYCQAVIAPKLRKLKLDD